MRILAIDTATEACSVALLCGESMIGRCSEVGLGHAEQILGMVDATLAEAGITLAHLDGIAASVGPGAFTGVRICVSVAQGLAFGAGLPVVAISTLEALALRSMQSGAHRVLAALDARMGEVYWGCFEADASGGLVALGAAAVGPPGAVSLPQPGPWSGIGRGFAAYPGLSALAGVELAAGAARSLPDAREMATLGAVRILAGKALDPADLAPQYLRNKVAKTELERAADASSTRSEPR